MRRLLCLIAVVGLWTSLGRTADGPVLEAVPLEDQMRSLKAEVDNTQKVRRARDIIHRQRLSSLQVKAIAGMLADDAARLEFATAAYPRIIDPENFYEVYDAFTTFSKVMRLHDRVQQFQRASSPPPAVPATITDQELKEIIRALKGESFDPTRKQLAQQIISNSRKLFLAAHVRQMLQCFDFEPNKLEVAKLAYEHTLDREKYFLVNEAFSFDSSRSELSRYIQSKNKN